MRMNRLFAIVYLLTERRTMTAKALAAHFEVSTRTILRDVQALTEAGIPIYTTQGMGGGIALVDRFVLHKTLVSDEEQNQMLFALQSLSATQHMDVSGVLAKLRGLFEKSYTDWIEVDFTRWGDAPSEHAKFQMMKDAILQKHALAFAYVGTNGKTGNRKVYPLKMVFKLKAWYLQAFCLSREDYRTFKMTRMFDVTLLTESFAGKAFSLPGIGAADGMTPPLEEVVLRFAAHVAYRIYDDFDPQQVNVNEDGSFTVAAQLPLDEWLCGYVLSFGPSVEVVGPQGLRGAIAQLAEKIREKYSIEA